MAKNSKQKGNYSPATQMPVSNDVLIGYCGKKASETDHLYGTGLTWELDTVHAVPVDQAKMLLRHADVWFDARNEELKEVTPIAVAINPKPVLAEKDVMPPIAVGLPHNFDELSAPELDAFAVRHFNVDLDHTLGIESLRTEVRALIDHSKFDQD